MGGGLESVVSETNGFGVCGKHDVARIEIDSPLNVVGPDSFFVSCK